MIAESQICPAFFAAFMSQQKPTSQQRIPLI